MAQITGATTNASFFIAIGSAGTAASALTDYSGTIISVTPGGGNRKNGEHYTADGNTALITIGKLEPEEWVFRGVYTNGSTGLYKVANDWHAGGSNLYFRYAPSGSASGNRYVESPSAGSSFVTTKPIAAGDAEDGSPAVFEFTIKTPTTSGSTY